MKYIINPYLLIISLFVSNCSFAEKTKITQKTYGNIHLVIFTNDYTENINTALIIGLYSQKLSKILGYEKATTLCFEENDFEPNLVFSQIDKTNGKNELLIRFKLKDFNISKSLSVIEYSILNMKQLNNDSNFYMPLYNQQSSPKIIEILKDRIIRPNVVKELERPDIYSYYIQNGICRFYKNENIEKSILELNQINDYFILDFKTIIIFTTNNEITLLYNDKIKPLRLEDCGDVYSPYKIKLLGNKIFLMQETSRWKSNRVAVYDMDKDILIQNIDDLIKS